jgi:hypothetical protein
VGVNAAMALTGQVASAGANLYTLDLGNVRGGSTITRSFKSPPAAPAPACAARCKRAPGLGHISDARLSGSGVADFTFGPIAAGGNGGDLSIRLAGAAGCAGGAERGRGQQLRHVATQTLQLSGFTSVLAQGLATGRPGGPGQLPRCRLPDASTTLSVTNTTTVTVQNGPGLGHASGFTASNVLGSGPVLPVPPPPGPGVATSGGAVPTAAA